MISFRLGEAARLRALRDLQLLDAPPLETLDRVCLQAQRLFDVPIALVTLLDEERQCFRARVGLSADGTPRAHAFCNYTILGDDVLVVPDASKDPRFAANPLVTGEPFIRFYAGAPLIIQPGLRLGSLCIIDRIPRAFTAIGRRRLARLGRLASEEIWMHQTSLPGFQPELAWSGGRGARPDTALRDVDGDPAITGPQLRAARGLLNWSVRELAEASGVGLMTVKRMEAQDGPVERGRQASIAALRWALEKAGVEFTFEPGHQPGVRPRH